MKMTRDIVVGFLGLSVLVSGCWADFPESRFTLDGKITPDTVQRDLVGPDLGPRDGDPGDVGVHDGPQTDARPLDLATQDLPLADVFVCTPNAFVGCAGKTLQFCNATGDALVTTSCSGGSNCSTSLQRCDQCDPASGPTCQGQGLRSCSAVGLYVTTSCPSGCQAGACCTDGDQDGAACDDCDDGNKNVFPGQLTFFATPRASGSYDYDCDNAQTPEFPDLVACTGSGANCGGEGWVGTVPACGTAGQFATCAKVSGNCTAQAPASKTQTCR